MSVSGRMKRSANCIGIIIEKNDDIFCGKVFNRYQKNPISFTDLPELFSVIEAVLDEVNYPALKLRKRFFKHADKEEISLNINLEDEATEVEDLLGKEDGFILMVTGRDNGTLQGAIYDTKEKKEISFDGDIELIRILNQ